MTISANAVWTASVDTIIRLGAQRAGLVPLGRSLQADEMGDAREHLQSILKSLEARGVGLAQWENVTLALTAGTSSYVLPADTVSVEFPMMSQAIGETTQLPIDRYPWSTYQGVIDKTVLARPLACYEERTHSVTLKFYPVPDKAYTVSYRRQKLIRDGDAGTTPDMLPRWTEALIYSMAVVLGLGGSLGAERIKLYKDLADENIGLAGGREEQGGDVNFIPDIGDFF